MRSFAIRFAALLFLTACGSSSSSPTPPAVTPAAARPLETFTSDAAGFDTHSFWLDTGAEVVVFDGQFTPALARTLIAEIRAKTASPIRWLVVTHPNPDKFNGAPEFQAIGAKVIASAKTAQAIPGVHAYKKGYFVDVAKSFTAETYPAEAKIDVTFDGDYELPLEGATKVELHELGHRGVSSTQTVAHVPRIDAVITGDLVHHEAHAWLEGGIVNGRPEPDLESWKRALDELSVYGNATVYGGRGAPAPVATAVAAQKAYLDRVAGLVTAYVDEVGPAAITGPDAGMHYKRLAERVSAAFPSYALPYMIEYGVYGLAQSIARR